MLFYFPHRRLWALCKRRPGRHGRRAHGHDRRTGHVAGVEEFKRLRAAGGIGAGKDTGRREPPPKEATMYELSQYAFVAAFAALAVALLLYLVNVAGCAGAAQVLSVGGGGSVSSVRVLGRVLDTAGATARYSPSTPSSSSRRRWSSARSPAGHGPFSNMYEFSLAFGWGALALYLYFEVQYQLRTLALLVLPVALGMLAYATTVPSEITPLVPALQNNLLLDRPRRRRDHRLRSVRASPSAPRSSSSSSAATPSAGCPRRPSSTRSATRP